MKTIPNNIILKSKGLGDTIGDIQESFSLDLSSNLGAIRTNRMKSIPFGNPTISGKPLAFCSYATKYYTITDNEIWKGGEHPSDSFTNVEQENDIDIGNSDMKVFNNKVYISGSTTVMSLTTGTSTDVISSGLTASPHLMEVMGARCYITDNFTKVRSFSTSDVLTTDGTQFNITLDGLNPAEWTITTIKNNGGLLWIGLLNVYTGKGKMYSWNGSSIDSPNSIFDLEAGVISSTVLDNILYFIDTHGSLKKYAGNSFVEVAKLSKDNLNFGLSSLSRFDIIVCNSISTLSISGCKTNTVSFIILALA